MNAMRATGTDALVWQLSAVGLPEPVREHRFDAVRRWRFDLAWPTARIAVEIDGGSWVGGRHTRGAGFAKDLEKLNAATLADWRIFRFTPGMVDDGTAVGVLERAFR